MTRFYQRRRKSNSWC